MKRKSFIASLIAIAGMMSPSAYAQLLKGTARLGEDYEFAVNYLPEGNLFLAQLNDVEVKADGSYTFDMDMAESELDVQIFVNDKPCSILPRETMANTSCPFRATMLS